MDDGYGTALRELVEGRAQYRLVADQDNFNIGYQARRNGPLNFGTRRFVRPHRVDNDSHKLPLWLHGPAHTPWRNATDPGGAAALKTASALSTASAGLFVFGIYHGAIGVVAAFRAHAVLHHPFAAALTFRQADRF
jgi:hypothetical protein